jgi:DNA-directed RNA polymerase sigma subunit (sigma70/sigma32)
MKECVKKCYVARSPCQNRQCRMNLEYEEDLNCAIIAVNKHGPMTLAEIAQRHGISTVRVKQIVDATLLKLKKTLLKGNTI